MRLTPRLLLPCLLACLVLPAQAETPAIAMRIAAQAFLDALTPEQKAKTVFPFADKERDGWNFVPRVRTGLPLKQMTEAQQTLALALVRTGLSESGFAQVQATMARENILHEMENGAPHRDPSLYYVWIFAEPAADAQWGWRFEGHHISLNFTVLKNGQVALTPLFIGSNPAEIRKGPQKGQWVLNAEENQARTLVKSFDAEQAAAAIFAPQAPADIITGNKRRVDPLSPAGLPTTKMTPAQSDQLLALLKLYLLRHRAELAEASLARIQAAGWEQVSFAWAGGLEPGEGHYYRIQGPTFLVEFDNTQDKANHIHSVWRDFQDDFGRDRLAGQ